MGSFISRKQEKGKLNGSHFLCFDLRGNKLKSETGSPCFREGRIRNRD
jgi:hypothetical protein